MVKHYKAIFLWLLILAALGGVIYLVRPLIRITPAVHIDYKKTVYHYAKEYDLEPALVFAVIKVESNYDPDARSVKDAYGLMQITEDTLNWAILRENEGASYTVKDLYEPEINIKYGCLILSLLKDEFRHTDTVLAAYNAGRGNVLKWLKDSRYSKDGHTLSSTPFPETNEYIQKVNKFKNKYSEMLGEEP